jgi:S1-C subfamily serine protease
MNTHLRSIRMSSLVLACLLIGTGLAAEAQPGGPPEGREPGMQRGAPRAALGLNIAGPEGRREDGVPVVGVSPDGAAAQAGLQAGDVLVSIDGKALKAEGDRSPQQVLMEHMQGVNPGDKVALEYRRDGKTTKVDVVTRPFAPPGFGGVMRAMPLPEGFLPDVSGPVRDFFRGAGVFGDIDLVPVTPKLGQYFGTDKGLLVLRAPRDSRLGLEEGDVIVDIAGRVPSGPDHAMRILGSYQAGEKLVINVLRMKKKVAVSIDVPAREGRGARRFERRDIPPGRGPANGPAPFNRPPAGSGPRPPPGPPRGPERA